MGLRKQRLGQCRHQEMKAGSATGRLSKKFPIHKGACDDPPLRGRKHLRKHLPLKGGLSQHCPERLEPATIFADKWKGLWLFLIIDTDEIEEAAQGGCEIYQCSSSRTETSLF